MSYSFAMVGFVFSALLFVAIWREKSARPLCVYPLAGAILFGAWVVENVLL